MIRVILNGGLFVLMVAFNIYSSESHLVDVVQKVAKLPKVNAEMIVGYSRDYIEPELRETWDVSLPGSYKNGFVLSLNSKREAIVSDKGEVIIVDQERGSRLGLFSPTENLSVNCAQTLFDGGLVLGLDNGLLKIVHVKGRRSLEFAEEDVVTGHTSVSSLALAVYDGMKELVVAGHDDVSVFDPQTWRCVATKKFVNVGSLVADTNGHAFFNKQKFGNNIWSSIHAYNMRTNCFYKPNIRDCYYFSTPLVMCGNKLAILKQPSFAYESHHVYLYNVDENTENFEEDMFGLVRSMASMPRGFAALSKAGDESCVSLVNDQGSVVQKVSKPNIKSVWSVSDGRLALIQEDSGAAKVTMWKPISIQQQQEENDQKMKEAQEQEQLRRIAEMLKCKRKAKVAGVVSAITVPIIGFMAVIHGKGIIY